MRRVEEEGGSYPGSSGRAGRIGDRRHKSGVGTTSAGAGRRRTGVALAVIGVTRFGSVLFVPVRFCSWAWVWFGSAPMVQSSSVHMPPQKMNDQSRVLRGDASTMLELVVGVLTGDGACACVGMVCSDTRPTGLLCSRGLSASALKLVVS